MNRKGFTLVELLAVIVILALILAIAVPRISSLIEGSKLNAYQSNEKMLMKSAKTYLTATSFELANDGFAKVIPLTDLIDSNYIGNILDVSNNSINCEGYVLAKNMGDIGMQFYPYLKCGSNYETFGYNASILNLSKVFVVEALVVAGGGSGGGAGYNDGSGGGGAGGLIYYPNYPVLSSQTISLSVGKGGNGVPYHVTGIKGDNSVFGILTAIGGGAGGAEAGIRNGGAGGSGGGAGGYATNWIGGAATIGQGNIGGANVVAAGHNYGGGGGGGAGSAGIGGTNQADAILGHPSGGSGLYYGDKFGDGYGVNGWFAGGGGNGGGYGGYGGLGGIGGGGQGGHSVAGQALGTSGISNTGGGGGGAGGQYIGGVANSGNGGSGIVLVRYPDIQKANGGIVTTLGGYTIHAFTTVGSNTFTVLDF